VNATDINYCSKRVLKVFKRRSIFQTEKNALNRPLLEKSDENWNTSENNYCSKRVIKVLKRCSKFSNKKMYITTEIREENYLKQHRTM
jgi:hypothetical protein